MEKFSITLGKWKISTYVVIFYYPREMENFLSPTGMENFHFPREMENCFITWGDTFSSWDVEFIPNPREFTFP